MSVVRQEEESMRSVCEKVFTKYLKPTPGRANTYFQAGQTMVMVESRQWKLAYSPLEKVKFDVSDEHALLIEVPGDHGVHLVPWHMVLRITVSEGAHL
jgi:hypothetical protein